MIQQLIKQVQVQMDLLHLTNLFIQMKQVQLQLLIKLQKIIKLPPQQLQFLQHMIINQQLQLKNLALILANIQVCQNIICG